MSKSQVFFYLLFAFILGVALASFVSVPILAVWVFFVFGGAMAVFAGLNISERQKFALIGFVLMVFALGILWFIRLSRILPSSLDALVTHRVQIEGIINDEPVSGAKSQRLVVMDKGRKRKVLIITRPYPEYGYGDHLKISGRLERPENFSEDFDYVSYLAKDKIFYAMAFPDVEIIARNQGSLIYQFLYRLKEVFAQNLGRHLPEPHSAFMNGLILGERQDFPPWLRQELQKTGTSHIVALSGYNITIVADALLKTLMFFFIPFSLAFWLAIAGITGFVMLTGAAASVVRAALMGILILIARREGRLYRMRNALAFAAAIMIFHNPQVLRFDVAFQLSFLATLGLLYGTPLVENLYDKIKLKLIPPARDTGLIKEVRHIHQRPAKKFFLRDVFISTLAAQLFVLPLLVYQFGVLSLISPVANLLVIPFIPATMFFGFLAGGAAFFLDVLAKLFSAIGWVLLHYELSVIHYLSSWPLATFEVRGFGLFTLIGGYIVIGYWLLSNFRSKEKHKTNNQA